jgi:hypothetical protein
MSILLLCILFIKYYSFILLICIFKKINFLSKYKLGVFTLLFVISNKILIFNNINKSFYMILSILMLFAFKCCYILIAVYFIFHFMIFQLYMFSYLLYKMLYPFLPIYFFNKMIYSFCVNNNKGGIVKKYVGLISNYGWLPFLTVGYK